MPATPNIYQKWDREAKEEYRRKRDAEKPEDRDLRIWRMNRDMNQRMDPCSWTPHNSTYPGPNYDPAGNIIPRHTGYTPCSSVSSWDAWHDRPAQSPEDDINNMYTAEAAEAEEMEVEEYSYGEEC